MTRIGHTRGSLLAILVIGAAASAFAPKTAGAADPQIEQAVAHGGDLFLHNTFGGRGKFCESCHLGGGRKPGRLPDGKPIASLSNAAAIFPRVSEDDGTLITLSDQIRTCVAGALNGKAPAYGSVELNSLVAYVTSLSQGKSIDMGGEPK